MNLIKGIFVPVFLDCQPSDFSTVLSFKVSLGIDAQVFTRMTLPPLLSPRRYRKIKRGWTDGFIASVLNDFAGDKDGKLLYLIPCTVFALELIEKERANLESNFIICNKIPEKGVLPMPAHLKINDVYGD